MLTACIIFVSSAGPHTVVALLEAGCTITIIDNLSNALASVIEQTRCGGRQLDVTFFYIAG